MRSQQRRTSDGRTAKLVGDVGWTLLGVLLAALVAGALFYDRSARPELLSGEATYLMQAESLARDFDLAYTRADFDRLLLRLGADPTDLALVSGSPGRPDPGRPDPGRPDPGRPDPGRPDPERITFDRPFPYALWLAPFVVRWPRNGFAIANALILALVCLLAARSLRGAGPWAPLVVAVAVFGSVLFAHVFLATGDLFLFALTLAGCCLIARPGASLAAALAAGVLLAVPVATDPLYGVLLAAAFFLPPSGDRAARRGLAAGALAMLAAIVAVHWLAGGGLPFTGSRFRFTAATGFPLVDFPAVEWSQTVSRLGALKAETASSFAWGIDLWSWNLIYLLFGRTIGLVPYFAPLILLLFGQRPQRRRALLLAAVAWTAAVVVLRPFDLAGGEGALANRLFLPVYGALFLVAGGGAPRRAAGHELRRPLVALAITLAVAAPFLGRLWREPWAHPIVDGRRDRHPTELARRVLPLEAGQRWLAGSRPAVDGDLEVVALTDATWASAGSADGARQRWLHAGPGPAELLIAAPSPVAALRLEVADASLDHLAVRGGRLGEPLPAEAGSAAFRIVPRGLRRHPTWWSPRTRHIYLLSLELPAIGGEVTFRLAAEPAMQDQEK